MIQRDITPFFQQALSQYPIVTLTGPRQSGKTTLARMVCAAKPYVSLENPDVRSFAKSDPRGFLSAYPGGAIFDEIQRAPELPSYLQGLVDEDPAPGRFVLTGSQQFELMRSVTQSLAGRTALVRLLPMSLSELCRLNPSYAKQQADQVILNGFYPRIHDRKLNPSQALADYFSSYVERDLRDMTAVHDLQRFERFVKLCAGRTGQLLNLSNLAMDAGVAHGTAQAWLDLLQTSCIVYLLQPWFTNTNKRLIRSPKLYFYDVGLAAWLLGLRTADQVTRDPLGGALFENFIVMEALKDKWHHGDSEPLYFYRDSLGHEIDLLIPEAGKVHAIEIKAGATVNGDYFKGLSQFSKDFGAHLATGRVIYGGQDNQMRSDWQVYGWRGLQRR
ncbi:MAG: ATP-binding protein [Cytophagales bacterium]|nr:ATP-binding protein [Cytophagales bacterium]